MNATGKKARKQNGLNHSQLHSAQHVHKSDEKRLRAGWGPKGQQGWKTKQK